MLKIRLRWVAILAGVVALTTLLALQLALHREQAKISASPAGTLTPTARPPFVALMGLSMGEGHVSFAREVTNTAELVTVDGKVIAHSTFKARMVPRFAGAVALLPAEAHVANGALYYADGDGVIWRLRPGSAQPAVAATFRTESSQHELSFAVAPDGKSIEAILYEFGPTDLSDQDTTGPSYISLLQASSPTSTRLVWEQELEPGKLIGPQLVGWDSEGPLIADLPLASSETLFNPIGGLPAHVWHVDAAGNSVHPLGGPDCLAAGWQNGWVVCARAHNRPPYQVRDTAGTVQWSISPSLPTPYELIFNLLPSNDGQSFYSGGMWQPNQIVVSYIFLRNGTYRMAWTHTLGIAWVSQDTLLGYSGSLKPNFLRPVVFSAEHTFVGIGISSLTDPAKAGTWYVAGAISQ